MIEAKGHNGQIQFDGQYVTITRKGFLARTSVGKGEKRIHISQITAVQWKPAGGMVNGYIQFTIPGGNERRAKFGSQTTQAGRDENSVLFTFKQQPGMDHMRAAIEQAIAAQHAPQAAVPTAAPSIADELAKLADLQQRGLISLDDFQQAKRRLLG